VTASSANPFYVRITSSVDDQIYVTSSKSNPVYVSGTIVTTPLTSSDVTRKLYTDDASHSGKTGVQTILVATAAVSPNTKDYFSFIVDANPSRKQLMIYNNCKDSGNDQSLYVMVGTRSLGDIVDDSPTAYTFSLPTANLYTSEPGTAQFDHTIYVLTGSTTGPGTVFVNITEIGV